MSVMRFPNAYKHELPTSLRAEMARAGLHDLAVDGDVDPLDDPEVTPGGEHAMSDRDTTVEHVLIP